MLVAVLVYAAPSQAPNDGAAQAARESRAQARESMQRALEKAGVQVDRGALEAARAERAAGWVSADELGFFARARDKANEGRRLLERVELDDADGAFAEAERIYEQHLSWPGAATLWSQAALWHGVTQFERGQTAEARKLFQRAVALDPTSRLTEASARPDVVRAFGEAVKPRAQVPLSLHTLDGATLTVDGQAPKPTVQSGEHVVVARAPGRLPLAVLADDTAGLSLELEPKLDPALVALDALEAAPTADGLRQLALLRGLDGVYVATTGNDLGEAVLVGARADAAGCATAPAIARRGEMNLLASSLLDQLSAALPRCPGAPEAVLAEEPVVHPRPAPVVAVIEHKSPPKKLEKKKRIWERPWIWLGLLAVTTAGIAVGAALAPSQPSYRATVDSSAFAVTH
jgi:hypothetical protein